MATLGSTPRSSPAALIAAASLTASARRLGMGTVGIGTGEVRSATGEVRSARFGGAGMTREGKTTISPAPAITVDGLVVPIGACLREASALRRAAARRR